MRALTYSVLFFALACGKTNVLPDGGRVVETCSTQANVVTLRVLTAQGQPASGATVTAVNTATGSSLTATTNGAGITTGVDERLGEGASLVTAILGSNTSNAGEVIWTCDACQCTPSPAQLTLTLNP